MSKETAVSQELDVNVLVQLHAAEYQALTTRCNYRLSFQFGLWGTLLLYLPLVYYWKSIDQSILIWFSVLIFQGAHAVWLENLLEIYRSIEYIEQVLRPLLLEVLPPHTKFWEYERHLARFRPKRAMWWELSFSAVTFVAMILLGSFRFGQIFPISPLSWQTLWKDALGLSINLLACFALLRSTVTASKLRFQMTARGHKPHDRKSSSNDNI